MGNGIISQELVKAIQSYYKDREFFCRGYCPEEPGDIPHIQWNADIGDDGKIIYHYFGGGVVGWEQLGQAILSLPYPEGETETYAQDFEVWSLNKIRLLERTWKKELLKGFLWRQNHSKDEEWLSGESRPESYSERELAWKRSDWEDDGYR